MMLSYQQRQLMVVLEREEALGRSPSVTEIAQKMRCRSRGKVHKLIVGLEERGFIKRLPHRARAIEIMRRVSRVAVFKFENGELHKLPS